MTNPALLVFTSPTPGKEAEYNEWYTDTHLREVLEVPGIVAAQRWKVSDDADVETEHRYLAIYELDERPPAEAIAALIAAAPTMTMSPGLGGAQMVLYEPLTGRVVEISELAS